MLTLQELKKSSLENLLKEIGEARRENIKLRMAVKTGQSKDIHKLRGWKKYIARLLTFKVEKVREEATAKPVEPVETN